MNRMPLSAFPAASFSKMGPIILQGPHHVAVKSTITCKAHELQHQDPAWVPASWTHG
jgi:hypothetical protein